MTWARVGVGLAALLSQPAFAHDIGIDLDGALWAGSADVPRVDSAGATLSGGYDFGETLSLFGALSYRRALPTRVADAAAGGGDLVQLGIGALWFGEHGVSALLGFNYSPESTVRSATTLRFKNAFTDGVFETVPGVVANTTTSLALTVGAGLATSASLLSAQVTASRYELGQRFEAPPTPKGEKLAALCAAEPGVKPCPLVNGKTESVWQARVGLTYTATLGAWSLGVEGAAYFFDSDPVAVGSFSVAVLDRSADAGSDASAAFLATAKAFAGVKAGRVTLRLSYQLGAYAADQGLGHQLTLRSGFAVTDAVTLTLALTGQADQGETTSLGASALVGAAWVF